MSSSPLPKFGNPPVVEVALSILFDPLLGFRSAHAGLLWERIKDQFPVTEDQPELPPAIEEPSAFSPPQPPRLEIMERPRLRTWFQNADGTQLLQIQHNRIAYNWKRGINAVPYPSYETVEQRFRELLPVFMEFINRQRLGDLVPIQAEVTYVNHIRENHQKIGEVFTVWPLRDSNAFLPPPEDVRMVARYPITNERREFVGRLMAEVQPAYLTSDRTEVISLNMIARGKPDSQTIDGAFGFLNRGHEWIVRGFVELTTSAMHAKWDRKQ